MATTPRESLRATVGENKIARSNEDTAFQVQNVATLRALSVDGLFDGQKLHMVCYATVGDGGGGDFYYDATSVATDDGGFIFAPTSGAGRFIREQPIEVTPEMFGAKGDGVTNDTSSINAAILGCYTMGARIVSLSPDKNYLVARRSVQAVSILLLPGVSFDGNGATITQSENAAIIGPVPGSGAVTITADLAVGDTQLEVDSSATLSAGNQIGIRLGNNAYDAVETALFFFCKIKSVDDATHVTVDVPMPSAMTVGATAAVNRRIIKFTGTTGVYENCFIRNLKFAQGAAGNIESCIDIGYARNVVIENIYAVNPGAGAVLMRYCFSCEVRDLWVPESICQGGQASKGRAFNMWNSENIIIDNLKIERFQGHGIFVESYCKNILFRNCDVNNNWVAAKSTARNETSMLFVGQLSNCHFNGLTIRGLGTATSVFDVGGSGGVYTLENVRLKTDQKIKGGFDLSSWVAGALEISTFTFRFSSIRRMSHTIRYSPSWSDFNPLTKPPTGFILSARYYCSSAPGGSVFITGNGTVEITTPTVGAVTGISNISGYGTDFPQNETAARRYNLYSSASPGENTFITFDYIYIPTVTDDNGQAMTQDTRESVVSPTVLARTQFENTLAGGGVFLKSPDGTRYKLTVDNAGALSIVATPF